MNKLKKLSLSRETLQALNVPTFNEDLGTFSGECGGCTSCSQGPLNPCGGYPTLSCCSHLSGASCDTM